MSYVYSVREIMRLSLSFIKDNTNPPSLRTLCATISYISQLNMHKHTHVLLNRFTFPKCEEEDCGELQFSKGILPPTERAGMTERQEEGVGGWFGGFGERGRMFSTGNMNR